MNMEQEEAQRLSMEYEYAQSQLRELQRQLAAVEDSLAEASAAILALDGLTVSGEGPLIFPLGSGTLLKAQLSGKGKVLQEVGARVFVEKSPEDAKKLLVERQAKLEDASKRLKKTASELLRRAADIRAILQVE